MKSKVLLLVLMLLAMCVTLIASEDGSDPEEYFRKTKELDKMANKFKAETGFQGSIEYGYEKMILGSFEGNFSDIQYSSDGDTIAYRQACEKVLNKILPYSKAIRSQLSMSRIRNQWSLLSTYYYQQVNGYRVEGLGFVKISYDIERKRFHIGEGTVELPEGDVELKISKDEAIKIAKEVVTDENALPGDLLIFFGPKIELRYCNIHELFINEIAIYRLCWIGGYRGRRLMIDAISGEVYVNRLDVVHDLSVNVSGTALIDSDNLDK